MTQDNAKAIEAATKAVLDAMDITDGLDVIAAETYAKAAVLAFLRASLPSEGMIEAGGKQRVTLQAFNQAIAGPLGEQSKWVWSAMLAHQIREIEGE